ncbi:MAG: toxin-antitoxin system TumE family protein [Pararhizobium sp.]
MRGRRGVRWRKRFDGGAIVEIRIWRLPHSTQERPHGLNYSLFYGRAGPRIVGYDNELGKGDHRHYREREEAYTFVSFRQLVLDF